MRILKLHRWPAAAAALVIAVSAAAAWTSSAGVASADLSDGNVSLTVLSPTPGQVVTGPLPIHVIASGYRLDARYAGTPVSPFVGHYHEILDGHLVDMTPYQDPAHDTVPMVGVTPGPHVLTLVPARNDHSMIWAAHVDIPFTYAGPYLPEPAGYTGSGAAAISIAEPADGSTVRGSSFSMTADINNFVVCGECFGKANVAGEGHWHIFLDQPMMANMLTMAGGPTQDVSLKGVAPGWHTFWAVLVNNQHMPFMDANGLVSGTFASVRLFVPPAD